MVAIISELNRTGNILTDYALNHHHLSSPYVRYKREKLDRKQSISWPAYRWPDTSSETDSESLSEQGQTKQNKTKPTKTNKQNTV